MKKAILAQLLEPLYDFVVASEEATGIYGDKPTDDVGFLCRSFLLSQVRTWLHVDERADESIFEALDELIAEKKLKIWGVGVTRFIAVSDIMFRCLLGVGIRGFRSPFSAPQVIPKFFADGADFKRGKAAISVVEEVHRLRGQRDRKLEEAFGPLPDLTLEGRLYREGVLEEAHLKAAIKRIANEMDKKAV